MDHEHHLSPESPRQPVQADRGPDRRPRGHWLVAWVVIVFVSAVAIVGNLAVGPEEPDSSEDPVGVMLMTFQSQALVGLAGNWGGTQTSNYSQARALNAGTVAQRQRFIVLAAELAGPAEAARKLQELDALIAVEQAPDGEPLMSEPQRNVHEVLHKLYPASVNEDQALANAAALDASQRALLEQELGWFGILAQAPPGSDAADRQAALATAGTVATVITIATTLAIALLLVGFVALIIVLVLALGRNLQRGLQASDVHHGIYAETFAVWMLLFFGLQTVIGLLASPDHAMLLVTGGFFLSLVALAWPRVRGISWSQTRRDVGLTLGRKPLVEPLVGVLGYAMALPMLALGVMMMLALMAVQGLTSEPETNPFAPAGGPSHPVVEQVAGASWWPAIQILIVAAVAAPIVEEIMFRGVLYRHLRQATDPMLDARGARTGRGGAMVMSVIFSATFNAFLFAVIHPQGIVAVPALMALAYAFVIVREWRGTIIPAMVVHGISNGLVMSLLIFMARSAG